MGLGWTRIMESNLEGLPSSVNVVYRLSCIGLYVSEGGLIIIFLLVYLLPVF